MKCTKSLLGIALVAGLTFVAPTAVFAEGADTSSLPAYELFTGEEAVREKYSFYNEGELVSEQYIQDGDYLYEPEAKVIEGKVFVGWFDEEGNKIDFWSGLPVSENKEIKVNAEYEDAGIVAHFVREVEGEEIIVASQIASEDGKVSLDVELELGIDEYLEGWDDNGTVLKAGQEVTISENKTYKAVIRKKVWVEFDTGEGATQISSVALIPGSTATKPSNPEKQGYSFVEWQLDGEKYNFSKTVDSDITLTAVWKVETAPYTIVVRRENLDGEMKPVQIILDREAETESTVTVSATDSEITFSDIDYYEPTAESFSATVSGDGTTIVYVDFVRKEYTFEFDFESNTGLGALAGQRYAVDGAGNRHNQSTYTITAKLGDDVSETWATTVGNIRDALGIRGRFYAWRATNLDGRPLVGGNITTITPQVLSKTETTITLEMVLAGIFDNRPYQSDEEDWEPSEEVEEPTFETGETVYYVVKFDLDGGESSDDEGNGISREVEEGKYVEAISEPTKEGYTFGGWKDSDDDTAFDFEKVKILKDTNLIAIWIPNEEIVRVCYVDALNNETFDELNYTENAVAILNGYNGEYGDSFNAFVGWQVGTDYHYGPFGELFQPNGLLELKDYVVDGVVRLVAALDYPEPTADIVYIANNDSEEYAHYTGIKRNADYEIIENEFTMDGYRFVEWNTLPDGSGISYQPGDLLALDSTSLYNELYAIWEEIVEEPEEVQEETTEVSSEFENPVTYDGISLYFATFIFAGILAGGIMFSKQRA